MNFFRSTCLFATLAVVAVWFGGLTFYAGVVVPIGTDILGSARAQGEITQQVTYRLNWIGTLAIAMLWADHFLRRHPTEHGKRGQAFSPRFTGIVLLAMTAAQIGLFIVHGELSAKIDHIDGHLRIKERSGFYSMHQVYLWITILHWAGGLIWLYGIARELASSSLNLSKATGIQTSS